MGKRKRSDNAQGEGFGLGATLARLGEESWAGNSPPAIDHDDEGWTTVGAPKKRRIPQSEDIPIAKSSPRSLDVEDGHSAAKSAMASSGPGNKDSRAPEPTNTVPFFTSFSEPLSESKPQRSPVLNRNPFSSNPQKGSEHGNELRVASPAGDSSGEKAGQSRADRRKQRKLERHYPVIERSHHAVLQHQIRITDLQSLILYILADAPAPQWVAVKNRSGISRVVALMVPGLDLGLFNGETPLESSQSAECAPEEDNGTGQETPASNGNARFKPKRLDISSKDSYPAELKRDRLPDVLKPLSEMFTHVWPIAGLAEKRGAKTYFRLHSPISSMLTSQIPRTQEEKKMKKSHKGPLPQKADHWQNKRTPITEYIATLEEQLQHRIVAHPAWFTTPEAKEAERQRREAAHQGTANGWVDSLVESLEAGSVPDKDIQNGSVTAGRDIYAVDCEMVKSELDEQVLAKITVTNWDGERILDEYVRPDVPIKDYVTQWSGITPELLDGVKTSLSDIQARLLKLLTPRAILVGHSLDSDLQALKLTHPFLVDSAILYPHPNGPPAKNKLQFLCKRFLSREIQQGTSGHDSAEDARAALDLVKQKCERGPGWGTGETNAESIFKRLGRSIRPKSVGVTRTGAVIDWGQPTRGHGGHAQVAISCKSDEDVVEGMVLAAKGQAVGTSGAIGDIDFIWGRLRELELARGWWDDTKTPDVEEIRQAALARLGCSDDVGTEVTGAKLGGVVGRTVKHIAKIYEGLPAGTAFIVYSGTGDPRDMRRLQAQRMQFQKEYQTKKWDELSVQWTDTEQQELSEAVRKARYGAAFIAVK